MVRKSYAKDYLSILLLILPYINHRALKNYVIFFKYFYFYPNEIIISCSSSLVELALFSTAVGSLVELDTLLYCRSLNVEHATHLHCYQAHLLSRLLFSTATRLTRLAGYQMTESSLAPPQEGPLWTEHLQFLQSD